MSFFLRFFGVSRFSQIAPRSFLLRPSFPARAMDSPHQSIQYHLARALMHLNQLASFIPSFEYPGDWGSNPAIPRHHGQSSGRHLHTFVPLPTEPGPPASLASHGGLPSHFVMNPEPRFRAMSERSLLHADNAINRAVSSAPPSPHEAIRTDENHHPAPKRLAPRAKQASRSTAPRTIGYPPAPTLPEHHSTDIRSSKRPRNTYMVESVNRFGSPPHEGASSHARSNQHSIPEPEVAPPTNRHNLSDVDSDPEPVVAKASSPTPTIPGHESPAPVIPMDASGPTYTKPLDPAVADHRNRPWPPCDDRELIQYKMDTKSRPSWKTLARRMSRTAESCQARWQWLKNSHPELLTPTNPLDTHAESD